MYFEYCLAQLVEIYMPRAAILINYLKHLILDTLGKYAPFFVLRIF